MFITRRAAWFLVLAGVFQWVVWPTFLRNIAADPRAFAAGLPTSFFIVHLVLAVASLAMGAVLLLLGARAVRVGRRRG